MLMNFFNSTLFNVIQNSSDLSHASSGAGNEGKCSESCFLVFLEEQGMRDWETSPKGKEREEK